MSPIRWRSARLSRYLSDGVFYDQGVAILKREGGEVTFRCGFCQGNGRYSRGATCPSCSGRGTHALAEPIVGCGYCGGSGRAELRTGTTCPSCRGRGAHAVTEPFITCPTCHGNGRKDRSRLSCHVCSGKGVVADLQIEKKGA